MPRITWCDALSVGFPAIDNDHKKLIKLFNDAHGPADGSISRESVEKVLTELIDYTYWHFTHEETLMEEHDYDNIEAHKLQHRELADNARELHTQFVAGDETVVDVLLPFLRNWLVNHILGPDKRLGDFLTGYRRREL